VAKIQSPTGENFGKIPDMENTKKATDFNAAAGRALDLTGRLIDQFGPRPAGSDKSRATADALNAEAASFADAAWSEDFPVRPGAFLGWIRILVLLYIISVVLLWFERYLPAVLLVTLGLGIMVGQFFLYRELIDRFYPRRTGRNVLASIEPVGEVKGTIDYQRSP
jgi:aminopeptidase YwaD